VHDKKNTSHKCHVKNWFNIGAQEYLCNITIHDFVLGKHLQYLDILLVFSEVRYMLSPVRVSSVTFVRPTQAIQLFGNISMALGTLAIH